QNEKWMIKNPSSARVNICRRSGLVQISINVEADGGRLPFDCKDVINIREMLTVLQRVYAGKRMLAEISWRMQAAVIRGRLASYVLHDVYLATLRPSGSINVTAKQPECRPYPLTKREFDPSFELAELLSEFTFGDETGRGIVSRYIVWAGVFLLESGDDHLSLPIYECILKLVGVILQLVVS